MLVVAAIDSKNEDSQLWRALKQSDVVNRPVGIYWQGHTVSPTDSAVAVDEHHVLGIQKLAGVFPESQQLLCKVRATSLGYQVTPLVSQREGRGAMDLGIEGIVPRKSSSSFKHFALSTERCFSAQLLCGCYAS